MLRNCYWNRSNFADVLNEVLLSFERINLYTRLPKWEEDIKNSQKFLCFYAKQFKTILIFTQSTQESDTELHLLVTQEFIKYFFGHDHFSYAHLLIIYFASMQEFEKILMDTWHEFTNKKFCLTKSLDQLTSQG